VALNANGALTYAPAANFNGTDSFTYKANDGTANSNVATVFVTVIPVNDAPVAANDSYTTTEDTTLTVAAPAILANDTDVDSPVLTASLVSGPAHGSMALNAKARSATRRSPTTSAPTASPTRSMTGRPTAMSPP
jgi:hypothetical protein